MKALGDRTTVVLVGAFNPAILSPQWVSVHGLGRDPAHEFQVEMLAPIGGTGQASARFAFDGFCYSVGFKNFTLHADFNNVAQSTRGIEVAANILSRLPHTPINGLGVNFSFSVAEPEAPLLALLSTSDDLVESFGGDAEVVRRRWGNSVKWGDAVVNIECNLVGDEATIKFNFHYSVGSAAAAEAILREPNAFDKHRQRALEAATALTGQQLEA